MQYFREEEARPLSWNLEKSLVDLHNTIALTAPSILPLVNQLGDEIRRDRYDSHRRKADMLVRRSRDTIGNSKPRSRSRTHASPPRCGSDGNELHSHDQSVVRYNYYDSGDDWSVASNGLTKRRSAGRRSGEGSVDGGNALGSGQKMAFFRRVEDTRDLL